MATSIEASDTSPGSPRPPVTSILAFMLLGATVASLGFGGVLYYLARSGHLSMRRNAVAKAVVPAVPSTHLMVLNPLLVNLRDKDGSSYLRLGMTLQIVDSVEKKDIRKKEDQSEDETAVAVRDTVLTVLGRQNAGNLLAPEGKEQLKLELKKALAEHNGGLKVGALFFTDFLIQQ